MENLYSQLPSNTAVQPGARLCDYTTFRLGGPCPALIDCPDAGGLEAAVQLLNRHGAPYLVIGQGSNLLVSDEGLDAVVLRYCSETPEVRFEDDRVIVSGATLLDDLARLTIERGLGDLSYCSGIPGTVGGAIAGNAGAFGRQIGDAVESVELLDGQGRRFDAPAAELGFDYRTSVLKTTGAIVLRAVLQLQPTDAGLMRAERSRILELRRTRHPDWRKLPCAGSVFRNIEPSSAAERRQAAGWFLEQAGAKAFRVGGARLFDQHANIIIADPGTSARDVYELTLQMIAAVEQRFGFTLEREIRLLGPF